MFKKIMFITALLALLLTACARSSAEYAGGAPEVQYVAVEEAAAYDAAGAPAPMEMESVSNVYGQTTATTVERLVIKNVSLSIAVDDPVASMERISALAEEMGGFVVSANMYQYYLESGAKVPQGSITIRVPAELLNDAVSQIKTETTQPVISENVNSQDVTAEYVDLQSRLTNLEAAEEQLQEIMDAATKTEDVLAVYAQLTSVREQIELIIGQMQYYEQAASLSSISVELIANEAVQPLTIGGWQPVGVAKEALQALINTLKALANIAIWLVIYVLPVALVVFGLPLLIVLAIVRRRRQRKLAKPQAPPQAPG